MIPINPYYRALGFSGSISQELPRCFSVQEEMAAARATSG